MKKMRLFLTLVLTTLSFLPVQAERVNIEKAEKIARSYARTTPRLTARRDFRLSRTITKRVNRKQFGLRSAQQQEEPMYYVFSTNNNKGFIIISGDDVATPILAYSDEGTFDESNLNLAYWMETLAQEIAEAIENDVAQDQQTQEQWDALNADQGISLRSSGDYVDPLVATRWNQNAPYYNLCPLISTTYTVTGCVATAMAQIMKYHEYPATRTVTLPAYITRTEKTSIPAITGTTTYGWNSMTNIYTSSATGTAADAVARLMYECGVSVEMDYRTSATGGSGAYSSAVAPALKNYFGYDAGIAYHNRNYYSYVDWINLLKTEIRAGRPVYYAGEGSSGHAFVCDGYDTNDLFHFNWGWGGNSDGYFEVSALNPRSLGIGGGSGGYNQSQAIITGIQPPAGGTGQQSIQLGLSTVAASTASLSSLSGTFSVSATRLVNIGAETISEVYLGVLLCNQDDSYYSHQTTKKTISIPRGSGWTSYTLLSGYSLPANLPVGTYKLYPAYSASSGIPSIIPGENGNRYITVVVGNNGSVNLSSTAPVPVLSLVSLQSVGNIYQSTTGNFEAQITNSGTADYNSNLQLQLGTQVIAKDPVVIPAGTTKTIGFSGTVTLTPATYNATVWYNSTNTPSGTPNVQLGNAVPIVVKSNPGNPSLSLISSSFQNGSTAVPQNAPNLMVQIKNTGGLFAGQIQVYIYPTNSTTSIGSFGAQNGSIENGETKSFLFNNPIDALTVGTQYRGCVFYTITGSSWTQLGSLFPFTVAAPSSPSSDATLKNLVVKNVSTQASLALSPSFTSGTTDYTVVVAEDVSLISIIGESNHARAKFTNIENQTLSNGVNTFDLVVTAENESTTKTYTVKVMKGLPIPGNSGAVTTSDLAAQSLKLNWTKATDNVTPQANLKYYVYRSNSNNVNTVAECATNGTLLNASGTANIAVYSVSGLAPNTTYYFNIVVENGVGSKAAYTGVSATTAKASLSGTVTISGTAIYGQTLTAQTNSLTSVPSVVLGTRSYQWKRNGTDISGATNSTYTLVQDDITKTITVAVSAENCTGSITSVATSAVAKASQTNPPATPTAANVTATSITLNTISGSVEYSKDGTNWQDSPLFGELTSNTAYTFHARFKESATHEASPSSTASFSTAKASLGGTVTISGTATYGQTLTAQTASLTSTPSVDWGTLSYQWKRNGTDINGATGQTYTLIQVDITATITVTVSAENCTGSITSAPSNAVVKASQTNPPATPTAANVTATSINLNTISGSVEYSKDGTNWQDSPLFGELTSNTAYTFYARFKESATQEASPSSTASFSTAKASLSGTVTIIGTATYGETLTAQTASLTSVPNVALETLSYQWKRNGTDISGATSQTYTLVQVDITATITVTVSAENCTGSITSAATGAVAKASQTNPPATPTTTNVTATSITLNTISDNVEYSKDGTSWQNGTTFSGLTSNTAYTFYARFKESATQEASPSSTASISTLKASLSGGTVTIIGTPTYGETLTAQTASLTSTPSVTLGTLSYQWKRNGTDINGATAQTYTLVQVDITATITVTVSAENCTGSLTSAATNAVAKASQTNPPTTPTTTSVTATSITLNTISGSVEYSKDGTNWQDSPTFSGLTSNTAYTFYARFKGSATQEASPSSTVSISTAKASLSGTVTISGTATYGQTLTAQTASLTSVPSGALGTRSYQWKRNGANISSATGQTYTLVQDDITKTITVEVSAENCTGSITSTATNAVAKASQTNPPATPTEASVTATSITLNTISGSVEYSKDGTNWQDSPTFGGLTSNTAYTFYARFKGSATHEASPSSTASISTATAIANLSGTVTISGTATYGQTLTAQTASLTSTPNVALGTLSYQWKRNGTDISGATNSTYNLAPDDITRTITVAVSAANCTGSITSAATNAVAKASQTNPPATPTATSVTATSITLYSISGSVEYSKDGTSWQNETTFNGLTLNTAYTFYARFKESATHEASSSSTASISTAKASLSGTVTISGTATYGQTLSAQTASLTSTPNVNLGTLSYQWKRNGANISGATAQTYTLVQDDITKTITVAVKAANCTGSLTSAATNAVVKASQTNPPATPTAASVTVTSITLNTIPGDVEYSKDGTNWQDSPLFGVLTSSTPYTFYARFKGSATHEASPASPASASISTTTATARLSGTVTISGTATYGQTLTAETASLTSTSLTSTLRASLGTLYFQWKRNDTNINGAIAQTYTLVRDDIGQTITVTVSAENCTASLTSVVTSAVAKASQTASTLAPTEASVTETSITLNTIPGDVEYSKDGTNWQDSPTFSGLASGASYTFYARIKENATYKASEASAVASFTTANANENAQVTIGSREKSRAASGLDLSPLGKKNLGLLLPNVQLGSNTTDFFLVDGATNEKKTTAAGLLVYNTNDALPNGKGLYVWDGAEWRAIIKQETAPQVEEYSSVTDEQGNVYPADFFGKAGWWMTRNLRTTTNLVPGDPSQSSEKFYYPSNLSTPEHGFLYTWAAATNRTDISGSEGNDNHEKHQGICPTGWHLPSDHEWSVLEKEIATNPGNYSSQANAYMNADNYNYGETTGARPSESNSEDTYWGRQMKSMTPFGSANEPTYGTSNPGIENGFDALIVSFKDGTGGLFENGTGFWSSSSNGDTEAWGRYLYPDKTGVERAANAKHSMLSVRCKKD
jgi:uncharacterized protein (TIGR02145 family)